MDRATPAVMARPLHEWLDTANGESGRPPRPAGELYDEMQETGAVLAGRRTAEQVDHYNGHHHGVPIVVVSNQPPSPSVASYPLVTYVTDGTESAMAEAKAAAGDRDVLVQGVHRAAGAGGRCAGRVADPPDPGAVRSGAPVVRRLPSRVELGIVEVIDTPEATHIRYASVAEPARQSVSTHPINRTSRRAP